MRMGIGIGVPMYIGGGGFGSGSPISVDQTASVQIIAQAFAPIVVAQTATASIEAEESGLVPAQLDINIEAAAITLGTTMRLTGTSPVVTLTGTLLFAAGAHPGIMVEITTGGALGVGVFRVSYDSGSTWAYSGVTLAATYALDGAAAGVTLNFAAGTYVLADTYEGTVATLRSSEGSAYTFTQATASAQPVLRKAAVTPDGKDALFHAGGTRWLASTDAAALALLTDDPALTVMGRLSYTATDATTTWFGAASSAEPTNRKRQFRQSNASAGAGIRAGHTTTDNAGTIGSNNTAAADHGSVTTNVHNECWHFPGSNGGASLRINDASVSLTATTANVGTLTPTRVAIGADADSTPASGFAGYLYRIVVFSSNLSAGDITAWDTELAA